MDIQKDKDFAALPEVAKLYQACKERDLTIAEREYLKGARDAWQATKAQAIPEGFVLVPKEPTDVMLFAASGRDIVAEHYGDENIMWPELRETWKAMLEAARGVK